MRRRQVVAGLAKRLAEADERKSRALAGADRLNAAEVGKFEVVPAVPAKGRAEDREQGRIIRNGEGLPIGGIAKKEGRAGKDSDRAEKRPRSALVAGRKTPGVSRNSVRVSAG